MRSTEAPSSITPRSGVNMPISGWANRNMSKPMPVMIAMPSSVLTRANRTAMSRLPAPRDCPTSVVAAVDTP